ncbi:hypothetical protein [Paenibacillus planticolens]|uniref:DUF4342 domain-containing protein n=1 Tax=Paenibacillus planticolens TaxID=2654976 RepID=A0ABX1ZVY6_9BACL|nr:hypothetical protein [Paenibacillus planticolens]NOV03986.1 hypothetical protein [Paenibacillus planticolens]
MKNNDYTELNKKLFDGLWSTLQEQEDAYNTKFLKESLRRVEKNVSKNSSVGVLKELIITPLFWYVLIAILVCIPAIFFLIVWVLGLHE